MNDPIQTVPTVAEHNAAVDASAQRPNKGIPPPANPLEFWTIYDKSTGKIRASGHGPAGSGALQQKSDSEAVLLERTLPASHRVNITLPEHAAEAV